MSNAIVIANMEPQISRAILCFTSDASPLTRIMFLKSIWPRVISSTPYQNVSAWTANKQNWPSPKKMPLHIQYIVRIRNLVIFAAPSYVNRILVLQNEIQLCIARWWLTDKSPTSSLTHGYRSWSLFSSGAPTPWRTIVWFDLPTLEPKEQSIWTTSRRNHVLKADACWVSERDTSQQEATGI